MMQGVNVSGSGPAQPLLDDPNTLHGLLLVAEGGRSLDGVAKRYGLLPDSLAARLEDARNGEGPRAAACLGWKIPMPTLRRGDSDRAESARAGGRPEVLLARWKRRAVRHMLAGKPLTPGDIHGLLDGFRTDKNGQPGAVTALTMLQTELGGLGFSVSRSGRGERVELSLDEGEAKALAALARNGWVMLS